MTVICISITILLIYRQIENYEKRETVWQISEKTSATILTPLVIICSEPHNFDPKSDFVYKSNHAESLQIKQLKTSMKVCKMVRSVFVS